MSLTARNIRQANRARRAIRAYAKATSQNPESPTVITDLLTDLMHACQFTTIGPLEFDELLEQARAQYRKETQPAAGV